MRDLWERSELRDDYRRIQSIIGETVDKSNAVIAEPLRKLVAGKGKLLRPMLVVLSSRYGKKQNIDKIHHIAAAIEILHLATLVHDDVIDDSPVRRGSPTLHTITGKKQAILTGDYLFSQCFHLVAEHATLENSKLLARAVSHICSSEISQAEDVRQYSTSLRRYYRRIAGKTAALFAISCFVGSSESGAGKQTAGIFSRIGYNLGMAFQIIDDILDYTGDSKNLGKPVGSDLREGIATLPLIYAMQKNTQGITDKLREHPLSSGTADAVIRLVRTSGGIDDAKEKAALYTGRAFSALERLPASVTSELLHTTLERLLVRAS